MKLMKVLAITAIAAAVAMTVQTATAQGNGGGRRGGGNFDPAEFQQRIMDGIREEMNVTNDTEWNVIKERLQKVMDARRDVGNPGGMGRLLRRGRGGDNADNGGGPPRRGGGFFGPPSPQLEALQQAIDNKAPTEQVKAAMERYRESRKASEAAFEKAQKDLVSVLTPRQEAVALSLGLVN
jgi:hypothetical protein